MGKKKKNINTKSNSNSTIGYSGKITITLKSGNTILSKQTYKNNGGLNLWYFICGALAGQYSNIEPYRPARIVLYWCKDHDVPRDITELDSQEHFIALTGEISVNRATEVLPIRESGITVNYTATLHFLIPPVYFKALSDATNIGDAAINTVVLYGKNKPTTLTKENYSAYYFFTTENDGSTIWDTKNIIKVSDIKDNYNITLDWEMSVDNR